MTQPDVDLRDVTLAVLAGGAGSRMGRPKGQLELNGVPILQHLLQQIAWPGPTLLVTAPGFEKPPGAERFNREAVDPVAGEGPARGVLTALEHADTPTLVVTPVDMPSIDRGVLAWLVEQLLARPAVSMAMMRRVAEDKRRLIEPFPLALRCEAMEIVHRRFTADQRSINGLATEPTAIVLDVPPDWPQIVWTNLNRPDDVVRHRIGSRIRSGDGAAAS